MRKDKLIALLKRLPGNPEIALWNGRVGDFNHIAEGLSPATLVKNSREFLSWRCKNDDGTPLSRLEVEEVFRGQDWGLINDWVPESEHKNWYGRHKKTVYLLSAKPRGRSTFDRLGNIDY